MIENGYSDLPEKKIREIKAPAVDTNTTSTDKLLTPEDIEALINACQMSRDRAIIALLYESGCRIGELGRLTWERVRFDAYGVIITVDDTKCRTQRYVRLVLARPFPAAWMNDYSFEPKGDALVFVNSRKRPLTYATAFSQLKRLGKRARIEKKIHPHIFRNSRITHSSTRA